MIKKFYYTPNIKEYIKQDFRRFGYHFDELENTKTNFDKNLILYENDIKFCIDNIESFSKSSIFIIIIDHHYAKHELMSRLDELSIKHKFFFLGTQYLKPLYKNIKTYSLGSSEDWCRHDFIKYIVDRWHIEKKPKIEKPFLFLSAKSKMSSHQERNNIIDRIRLELQNDILQTQEINQTDLVNKKNDLDKWINETFSGNNMLGGFGNGIPRFDLYDRTSCEIVLETIYTTETIHLSEKTWRPIACGQPAIYLINQANIERLESLGYVLEPTSFYNKIKESKNLNSVLDIFKESLEEIKKYDLSSATKKNFNHFWRNRSIWEEYVPSLTSVFGYCNVEELCNRLKSI